MGCPTGKIQYETVQDAWKVVEKRNTKQAAFAHKDYKRELNVYRCPFCHSFHLTSTAKKYKMPVPYKREPFNLGVLPHDALV